MERPEPCPHALGAMQVPAKRWSTRVDIYVCLAQAREYFAKHGTEAAAVQKAARFVGVSRTHFIKLFTETFHETPSSFITRSRFERVASALLAGQTISDAADAAGYSDSGTFCRAFKRRFGMTPSQYVVANSDKRLTGS
ncbi:MAG: helix-turn-helix transcriptional regulator [Armatimonadetes bacterium]|nr:helix-turn-helix transcriptional regulator [Armatimonadota bacterium]